MNNVRKAEEKDIPRILALYEELAEAKLTVSPETIQRVFNEIISLPNQYFLVAEKDGFVLGTLFLQIVPNLTHNARPWANIENVVVDSRYRGQGFGRLLIEHALAISHEAGCHKVQLMSITNTRKPINFTVRWGLKMLPLDFACISSILPKRTRLRKYYALTLASPILARFIFCKLLICGIKRAMVKTQVIESVIG